MSEDSDAEWTTIIRRHIRHRHVTSINASTLTLTLSVSIFFIHFSQRFKLQRRNHIVKSSLMNRKVLRLLLYTLRQTLTRSPYFLSTRVRTLWIRSGLMKWDSSSKTKSYQFSSIQFNSITSLRTRLNAAVDRTVTVTELIRS